MTARWSVGADGEQRAGRGSGDFEKLALRPPSPETGQTAPGNGCDCKGDCRFMTTRRAVAPFCTWPALQKSVTPPSTAGVIGGGGIQNRELPSAPRLSEMF